MEVIDAGNRLAIKTDDHVAFAKSCPLRWTSFLDRHHNDSAFLRKVIKTHQPPMQRSALGFDADVAAPDSSISQQPRRNKFRSVDANGKTQTLRHRNHG